MQKVVVSLSWFPLNGYGPPGYSDDLWYLEKGSTGVSVSTTEIMAEETCQKFLAGVFFISLELLSVGFNPHRVNMGFWIHLPKVELLGDRRKKTYPLQYMHETLINSMHSIPFYTTQNLASWLFTDNSDVNWWKPNTSEQLLYSLAVITRTSLFKTQFSCFPFY